MNENVNLMFLRLFHIFFLCSLYKQKLQNFIKYTQCIHYVALKQTKGFRALQRKESWPTNMQTRGKICKNTRNWFLFSIFL